MTIRQTSLKLFRDELILKLENHLEGKKQIVQQSPLPFRYLADSGELRGARLEVSTVAVGHQEESFWIQMIYEF